MKICQVEGTLVATARIGGLQNRRLLVVKERGSSGKQVAVDPVGCKPGDWVIAVGSSAARDAAGGGVPVRERRRPLVDPFAGNIDELVDHNIGRILDLFDIDSGLVKRWRGMKGAKLGGQALCQRGKHPIATRQR